MTSDRLPRFIRNHFVFGWFGSLYILFLFVVFGGMTVGLWNMYQTDIRLDHFGKDVRGVVTAKFSRNTDDGTEYIINYRYDAGLGDPPDIQTGSQTVSRGFYDRHHQSEPIIVTFLPDSHQISRVEPIRDRVFFFVFIILLGIFSLGLAAVLLINAVIRVVYGIMRLIRKQPETA